MIEILKASQLTAEQIRAWSGIQRAKPLFESPFFHPEFTLAVAQVRDDVELAILHDERGVCGFFPFHRHNRGYALPVGEHASDYHGVISRAGSSWNAYELLRGANLNTWCFNHLLAGQEQFAQFHCRRDSSPFMDLSDGFDAYRRTRAKASSDSIEQTLRKSRKMGRECGELRLEFNNRSPELLDTLFDWKRRQYRLNNVRDVLQPAWTRQLRRRLLLHDQPDCFGTLSVLYAGSQVAALCFGLVSRHVLHSWITCYDPQFTSYSPGAVLFVELAKAAVDRGITRIDFGKGPELYKQRFASGSVPLAEGFVDRRLVGRTLRNGYWKTRNWVRQSPLRTTVKRLAAAIRPLTDFAAARR